MKFLSSIKNNRGMSLLEIIIAGIIFITFVTQFNGLWISMNKQIKYVFDRSKINREAHIARALMTKDLSLATAVSLLASPDEGFNITTAQGTITYSRDNTNNHLARYEEVSDSSMTAAKYLSASTTTLEVDGSLSVYYEFSKSSTTLDLNLYWDVVRKVK